MHLHLFLQPAGDLLRLPALAPLTSSVAGLLFPTGCREDLRPLFRTLRPAGCGKESVRQADGNDQDDPVVHHCRLRLWHCARYCPDGPGMEKTPPLQQTSVWQIIIVSIRWLLWTCQGFFQVRSHFSILLQNVIDKRIANVSNDLLGHPCSGTGLF